jgi:hypothetical protein
MIRLCLWLLTCAAVVGAQTTPAADGGVMNALKAVAASKSATWSVLNDSLENRLAPLNPCDAQVRDIVLGTADASTARLDAWQQYLSARLSVLESASAGVRAARAALPAQITEAQAERGEIQRGTANIEVQMNALGRIPESSGIDVRESHNILEQLHVLAAQRATDKTQRESALRAAEEDLRKASSEPETKSGGAADEKTLIRAESELWRANYEARWVRAQVACVAGEKPQKGRR